MANPLASDDDPLKQDIGPGEGKRDEDEDDDELEALRLAAINSISIRPKEKTEPTGLELNLRNQSGALHPETETRDCPLYDAGFCRRGPTCWLRHARRISCMNYLAGFCPEGPACRHAHPRFELPARDGIGERESSRFDHTRATTPDDTLTDYNQNSEDTSRRRRSRSRSSPRSR